VTPEQILTVAKTDAILFVMGHPHLSRRRVYLLIGKGKVVSVLPLIKHHAMKAYWGSQSFSVSYTHTHTHTPHTHTHINILILLHFFTFVLAFNIQDSMYIPGLPVQSMYNRVVAYCFVSCRLVCKI
jgi:hypothetical protein